MKVTTNTVGTTTVAGRVMPANAFAMEAYNNNSGKYSSVSGKDGTLYKVPVGKIFHALAIEVENETGTAIWAKMAASTVGVSNDLAPNPWRNTTNTNIANINAYKTVQVLVDKIFTAGEYITFSSGGPGQLRVYGIERDA